MEEKNFFDVPVDGAGLMLTDGTSNCLSVAVQPNKEFLHLRVSLLICRLVECFVFLCRQPADHVLTLESSSLCSPFFLFHSVLDPLLYLARYSLLATSAHCR